MADENEKPAGLAGLGKASANATTETEQAGGGDSVAERAANPTLRPAFGKQTGDENEPLVDSGQIEAIEEQADAASDRNEVGTVVREAALDYNVDGPSQEGAVVFTSHPRTNLRIGPFQFENGRLELTGERLTTFRKMMEKAPSRTQGLVRELNTDSADRIAQAYLGGTRMKRGVDTAGGDGINQRPASEQ